MMTGFHLIGIGRLRFADRPAPVAQELVTDRKGRRRRRGRNFHSFAVAPNAAGSGFAPPGRIR